MTTLVTTSMIDQTGNLNISGSVTISGNSSLTGNVLISGNSSLTGNVLISGNTTYSNTVTLGAVANVKVTGGSNNQVLSTDGAGNLSWSTLVGGATLSAVAASTTYYVGLSANTSGTWTDARIDTTNLSYNSGTQTLFATNYNTSSDETLKTNIHTIENALAIINLLRGVGFDWTETSLKSYGVIAQELEKIIPNLVNTDSNGKKTVNYNALIGFLIEAIKTQSSQIQTLEERITRLEEK